MDPSSDALAIDQTRGASLREARLRIAGMTQERLADQLGVARQTVHRWEAGQSVPRRAVQPLYAGALQISTADLVIVMAGGQRLAVMVDDVDDVDEAPQRDEPRMEEQLSESFDAAVRDVTGEPLLGIRQGAAVDAMTRRLGTVEGSLSERDYAAWTDLLRILHLGHS